MPLRQHCTMLVMISPALTSLGCKLCMPLFHASGSLSSVISSSLYIPTNATTFTLVELTCDLCHLRSFSLAFGGAVPGPYSGLFGDPATYGLMYNVNMNPHPVYTAVPVALLFTNQLMQAAFGPSIIVGAIADR